MSEKRTKEQKYDYDFNDQRKITFDAKTQTCTFGTNGNKHFSVSYKTLQIAFNENFQNILRCDERGLVLKVKVNVLRTRRLHLSQVQLFSLIGILFGESALEKALSKNVKPPEKPIEPPRNQQANRRNEGTIAKSAEITQRLFNYLKSGAIFFAAKPSGVVESILHQVNGKLIDLPAVITETVKLALSQESLTDRNIWKRAEQFFPEGTPPLIQALASSRGWWAMHTATDGSDRKKEDKRGLLTRLSGISGMYPFFCPREAEVVDTNELSDRAASIAHNLFGQYFANQRKLEEFWETPFPKNYIDSELSTYTPSELLGVAKFENRHTNLLNWMALSSANAPLDRDWNIYVDPIENKIKYRTKLEQQTVLITFETVSLDSQSRLVKKKTKHYLKLGDYDAAYSHAKMKNQLRLNRLETESEVTGEPCDHPLFEVALVDNQLPPELNFYQAPIQDQRSMAETCAVAKAVISYENKTIFNKIKGYTLHHNHVAMDGTRATVLKTSVDDGYFGIDDKNRWDPKFKGHKEKVTQNQTAPTLGTFVLNDVIPDPRRNQEGFCEIVHTVKLQPELIKLIDLAKDAVFQVEKIYGSSIFTIAATCLYGESAYTCVSPQNQLPLQLALHNYDPNLFAAIGKISTLSPEQINTMITISLLKHSGDKEKSASLVASSVAKSLDSQIGANLIGDFNEYIERVTEEVAYARKKNINLVSLLGNYLIDELQKITQLTLTQAHRVIMGPTQFSRLEAGENDNPNDIFVTALSTNVENAFGSFKALDGSETITLRKRFEYDSQKKRNIERAMETTRAECEQYTKLLQQVALFCLAMAGQIKASQAPAK